MRPCFCVPGFRDVHVGRGQNLRETLERDVNMTKLSKQIFGKKLHLRNQSWPLGCLRKTLYNVSILNRKPCLEESFRRSYLEANTNHLTKSIFRLNLETDKVLEHMHDWADSGAYFQFNLVIPTEWTCRLRRK